MGAHDKFIELCAISTSGGLTEKEKTELQDHLAGCPECREILREYQEAAEISLPLFAVASSGEVPAQAEAYSLDAAEAVFQKRLKAEIDSSTAARPATPMPLANSPHPDDQPRVSEHWNHVWLAFAAAVLLAAALGVSAYQVGVKRGVSVVQTSPSKPTSEPQTQPALSVIQQLSDAGHDRQMLIAQMAERDKMIESLRHELEKQASELAQLRSDEAALQVTSGKSEEEKRELAANQSIVNQKLETAESALQKTQKELDTWKAQQSQEVATTGALQAKIRELTEELRDKEGTIDEQQELLAHDRDIRELMGARDLYIAEVFDIAKTGATQKPYGRVFFTKGKSLIFYAYDLDRQSGFKNASSFQAWGQRGADREDSLNLGVFYEDNVSKKRWVLKFDDPQKLNQIDSVFVTLEPHGGSQRPSSKPLLFAYLRVRPNHP
jgi:anti-sigma factor RsiW